MKEYIIMNIEGKNELIMQLIATLTAMLDSEVDNKTSIADNGEIEEKIEMLTIKQASKLANGISEHTIRQLVAQNKVSFLRCGQGQRGKILINKASLLSYLNNSN